MALESGEWFKIRQESLSAFCLPGILLRYDLDLGALRTFAHLSSDLLFLKGHSHLLRLRLSTKRYTVTASRQWVNNEIDCGGDTLSPDCLR
jgi:hypothetical protein